MGVTVNRAKSLLKVAAVVSSILLVVGFILYRVRAGLIVEPPKEATFILGTKSSYMFKEVPGPEGTVSSSTETHSNSESDGKPVFLPGTKQSPVD
jgi:hypothetical protein